MMLAAGLPAVMQWTQLLSQANVHRQGTMNRGPLLFKDISPRGRLIKKKHSFGYLTVHISQKFLKAKEGWAEFLNLKDIFLLCRDFKWLS
jgi:hypothetical protein